MATPHVAGVAALLRAEFPEVSAERIAEVLTSTAMPLGSPGRDNSYGSGLVQAVSALEFLSGEGSGGGNVEDPDEEDCCWWCVWCWF